MTFDLQSPKWRTCCCHVTTFTKVICWISIVLTTFLFMQSVAFSIIMLYNPEEKYANLQWLIWFQTFYFLLVLFSAICPIIAIQKTIPKLIIPLIVSHVLNLVVTPCAVLLDQMIDPPADDKFNFAEILYYIPLLLIFVWLLSVSIRCYLYLKGLKELQDDVKKQQIVT